MMKEVMMVVVVVVGGGGGTDICISFFLHLFFSFQLLLPHTDQRNFLLH